MSKVIVNFSGGKDSTVAVLETLKRYPKDEIMLCYQDTGADYLETQGHVEKIAAMLDLPLVTLKNSEDFWGLAERYGKFPLPSTRYCTHKLKKDAVRNFVRKNRPMFGDEVIIVTGLRREESLSRSKLSEWALDDHLTIRKQIVKFWAPCLDMKVKEVKDRIQAEGLPLHPCYDFSERCSCWLCFFQPNHVVKEYAEMQPKLYESACLVEDKIKHKWKDGFGFNDLMKQGSFFKWQRK